MRRALLVSAALVLTLAAGWVSPRLLIGDAVDDYSGDERAAAQDALATVERACSNRIGWRLVVPKLRVTDVELLPGSAPRWPGYRAEVREYTLFGISLGTAVVRTTNDDTSRDRLDCAF